MSDKQKHNNQNGNQVYIPDTVKDFAKASLKKFMKKLKKEYGSLGKKDKKEAKFAFYDEQLERFPDVMEFLLRYGHRGDKKIQDISNACYSNLSDPKFVKFVSKMYKDDYDIENIMYFPAIIRELVKKTAEENAKLRAQDPDAPQYDLSDLVELSQMILHKRIKKFVKEGFSEKLAFDVLSIIPFKKDGKKDILRFGQNYRIRSFYETVYKHAKEDGDINFGDLVDLTIDKAYLDSVCLFSLLERKDVFNKLDDNQKKLYVSITNWAFDYMNSIESEGQLKNLIKTYGDNCRRDEASGKGVINRRYALSSVAKDDYPKIYNAVRAVIAEHPDYEKYM